ncbi:hypothetical protein CBM2617_P370009 [Cupriavidus taiwanensis]|nr:hypothetical protein CBM2595_P360009 [Cupriavidus taiwanensis]SOZ76530.1 hypothetical protein CBM2617_P370009 [Cupriavidus taiwanensis]SOZ90757.1 hypothetical protein CBM2618_P370008 [Cupriavidus taiwanensis]SOZ93381.1 hypothetical protein CBM2622_P370011 [Cupriavidus taiwanensis]SOZ96762.1 hypothetical protein CBM2621_P360012 [Cupriavidus taiwanensis]
MTESQAIRRVQPRGDGTSAEEITRRLLVRGTPTAFAPALAVLVMQRNLEGRGHIRR